MDGELEAVVQLRVAGDLELATILFFAEDIPDVTEVLTLAGDPEALVRFHATNTDDPATRGQPAAHQRPPHRYEDVGGARVLEPPGLTHGHTVAWVGHPGTVRRPCLVPATPKCWVSTRLGRGSPMGSAGSGFVSADQVGVVLARVAQVTVHERDPQPFSRPQGYRITVDRDGIDALRRSVPAELFELIMRTSGPPGGHFRFTNEHLRDAFVLSFPTADTNTNADTNAETGGDPGEGAERQVDRDVLRRILLSGLGDHVVFGAGVRGVHSGPDGPLVEFADGTEQTADVVVVADGIGSTLGGMVFPDATPTDTGRGGIYGRTPLHADGRCVLPESVLDSGFLALLPTAGSAFFFTAMRFGEDPASILTEKLPSTGVQARQSYIMWGLVLPPDDLRTALADNAPDALLHRAQQAVRTAHPLVRALVDRTVPDSVLLSRFAAGVRPGAAALPRVAVLGDAIHPMPPFGAHGGNTALRDAAELGDRLAGLTGADPHALDAAVRDYHKTMSGYAYDAVDSAVTQMNRLSTANPLQRWMLRRLLPALHRTTIPA